MERRTISQNPNAQSKEEEKKAHAQENPDNELMDVGEDQANGSKKNAEGLEGNGENPVDAVQTADGGITKEDGGVGQEINPGAGDEQELVPEGLNDTTPIDQAAARGDVSQAEKMIKQYKAEIEIEKRQINKLKQRIKECKKILKENEKKIKQVHKMEMKIGSVEGFQELIEECDKEIVKAHTSIDKHRWEVEDAHAKINELKSKIKDNKQIIKDNGDAAGVTQGKCGGLH